MKKLSLLLVFVMLFVMMFALNVFAGAFVRGDENTTITKDDIESFEIISGKTAHGKPEDVIDGVGTAYWGGPTGTELKITFINEWEITSVTGYHLANWCGLELSFYAADGTKLDSEGKGGMNNLNTGYLYGGDTMQGTATVWAGAVNNISYGDSDKAVKYMIVKNTGDKWGYLPGVAELVLVGRERIPTVGCDVHEFDTMYEPEPTCTEDGLSIRYCVNCGATESPVVAPALGHDWSNGYTVLDPVDCFTVPQIQFDCTRCGENIIRDNHIEDVTDYADLTLTKIEGSGGWTNGTMFDNDWDKYQMASGGWYVSAELELDQVYYVTSVSTWVGHFNGYSGSWKIQLFLMASDSTEWTEVVVGQIPPTNYEAGAQTKHTFQLSSAFAAKAVRVVASGLDDYSGVVFETQIAGSIIPDIKEPGHQWVKGEVVAPTCIYRGYTNYACSLCEETKMADFVNYTSDHKYTVLDNSVETKVENDVETITWEPKDATCTEAGEYKYRCETCTSTKKIEQPALGHDWENNTVCNNCGETRIATIGDANYETLADAIAAAKEGETIVVLDKVYVEGDVTWDLTGKAIQFADIEDNYTVVVKGNLTIVGGSYSFVNDYGIAVIENGSLVIEDGSFVSEGCYYMIITYNETSSATISGGSYEAYYNVVNCIEGTLTITGGTFNAKDDESGYAPEAVLGENETSNVAISGGTFNTDVTAYLAPEYVQVDGVVVPCTHDEYTELTCENDSVCVACGKVIAEAEGHDMADATCEVPSICNVCGYVDGEPLPHNVVYVPAKAGTDCQTWDGNIEFWYCADCNAVWANEALTQVTNVMNVKTNGDHVYMNACDKVCLACNEETNPDADHTIVYVEAKEGTDCQTWDGNVEYWYCSDCGAAWANEALTQVTNLMNVKTNGDHVYMNACDKVCLACNEETNPDADHTIVYVEAKEGTDCQTWDGNVEYWYCSDCGAAWLDEARTLVTNLRSVNVVGSHTQTWDEEVYLYTAETCTTAGSVVDKCGVCGETFTVMEFPADPIYGHVAVEGTYVQVDANCKDAGYYSYECEVCGETIEGEIEVDAGAHDYNNGAIVDNKLVYTCTVCGGTEEHNVIVLEVGDNTIEFPGEYQEWLGGYWYESVKVVVTVAGNYTITATNASMDYVAGRFNTVWIEEFPYEFEVVEGGYALFNVSDIGEATALLTLAAAGCTHANVTEIPAVLPTPSNNGTTAGSVCADCGETLVAPVENTVTTTPTYKTFGINSVNLILGNNISLDYKVNVTEGYEVLYMVFVFEGKEFVVSEYEIDGGKLLYNFAETRPHKMAENVSAYVFAKTADGYSYDVYDYSVMKYCVAKLKKNESVNVISDLLAFGAATQKYVNPSVADEDLITSLVEAQGYTLTPTAFTSIPAALKAQYVDVDTEDDFTWKSSTVVLGSSTEMVYKFAASDITGLQIKIEVDGVQKMMIDASDLTIEGGRYVVSVNCVSAVQYGSEVKATFVINGVESDSVAYSINGFLYNNLAKNEGTALGDLMKALYVYGDTTYNYFYGE